VLVVQGGVRHWAEVEKLSLDQLPGPRQMRANNEYTRERPLLKHRRTGDGAVQLAAGETAGPLMPAPLTGFAGLNLSSWGSGWPPDPTGDVGLDHYVQAVNTTIGIFSKSTGALVSATTFDSFFGGTGITGTPCDNDNNGDPIVLFDRYAQRWFILDFAWAPSQTDGSFFSIAVSQTADPTGAWWQYALRADTTLLADYPKAGIWQDGIYLTANMFTFSNVFQKAKIWALKTPEIYSGTLTVQAVTDTAWEAWSILPANARSQVPPAAGEAQYLFAFDADDWGGVSDALAYWRFAVDWIVPANTVWAGPTRVPVASFYLSGATIPQPNTSTKLDPLDSRLMFPAPYMNYLTHQAVFLCHTVSFGGLQCKRWYEVRLASGSCSVFQQGTYAPGSYHRWMGSIAADRYNGVALGYSAGASTLPPSIHYAGRISFDPAGSLSQGEAVLMPGAGSQTSGIDRWGDYSTLSLDPVDDVTFWYTNEYYTAIGTDWQTRIGAFRLPGNGDLDSNGLRNRLDVDCLAGFFSGNFSSLPAGEAAADVTGNYTVDAADLALLLRQIGP